MRKELRLHSAENARPTLQSNDSWTLAPPEQSPVVPRKIRGTRAAVENVSLVESRAVKLRNSCAWYPYDAWARNKTNVNPV